MPLLRGPGGNAMMFAIVSEVRKAEHGSRVYAEPFAFGARTPRIRIPKDEVAAFCRKRRIMELALCGSALRGGSAPENGVDVLARFGPDAEHTLLDLDDMEQELGALLGRETHIGSWEAIERSKNPHRRKAALESARVIYDAA